MSDTMTRAERRTHATISEIRRALRLVEESREARALRASQPREVSLETPLADWLYAHWWTDGREPVAAAEWTQPRVGRLEAARRRASGTTPEWIVLAAGADALTVVPRLPVAGAPAHRIRVSPDRVVGSSRPGAIPAPGDLVDLARGSSRWDRDTGWWWAHTSDDEAVPEGVLDRWYVHARTPDDAAALLAPLLTAFAEAGAAASLKCLPAAAGYGRPDALVAYAPRPLSRRIATALRRRADAIAPYVGRVVAPTTRCILPGIGFAEDPDDGSSFGQRRTAQVAALAARSSADALTADDVAAVGIDPAQPWRAGP